MQTVTEELLNKYNRVHGTSLCMQQISMTKVPVVNNKIWNKFFLVNKLLLGPLFVRKIYRYNFLLFEFRSKFARI